MEYYGYGIYKGKSNDKRILNDAETIFDFLVLKMKYKPENILVFGRSIGSGPATYISTVKKPGFI